MDRKSILILAACFALIFAWGPILNKFYPTPPHAAVATNAPGTTAVTPTAITSGTNVATTAVAPAATQLAVPSPTAKLIVHADVPEEFLTISNAEARYVFTSRGGGLKEVQLLKYPAIVSPVRTKSRFTNEVASLNDSTLPPLFAIFGDASMPGDEVFKLSLVAGGVRAEKSFVNGLTVVKDFQLGTNYLLNVSVRFENRSAQSLAIAPQRWAAGAATPMDAKDNGLAEQVYWYNGAKSDSISLPYFNTNTSSFMGLFSRVPKTVYQAGTNNVAWVSAQNQFFTLATIPQRNAESLVVTMIELPQPTEEEIHANPGTVRVPMAMQAVMVYPGMTIPTGQTATNNFTLYAGPKEYQTLAHLAARFNNDLDAIMSFSWAGPISKTLLVIMNWMHSALSLPYGYVIVLITFVIKMIFWPLTAASVRSSKRMQALQPQLKALQEKYKDDPQKATAKQWEFYKKNKVNPLSGCLPAFLQIPVFIGFYGMLKGAIELRGQTFLWIGDLSKPDTIFSIPLPLHIFGFGDGFIPVNPMPLIMGATLLWGASLTPPSPSMDPSQQKMMKYMPLIMLVFMYNLSSGLALYWTVSNLLTVVQNKLTKTQPITVEEPAKVVTAPQKKKKD